MSDEKISLNELADRFERSDFDMDFDMDFNDLSPEAQNALNAVMEKLSFLQNEEIITITTPGGNKGFFYDFMEKIKNEKSSLLVWSQTKNIIR